MAEPKSIYKNGDQGNKYVQASNKSEQTDLVKLINYFFLFSINSMLKGVAKPFRNHSFGIAAPKTIHEIGDQGSKYVQASPQSQLEQSELVRGYMQYV